MSTDAPAAPTPSDFIRDIVAADVQSGKVQKVITRFPPEPNGYLHLGHAKSICLNVGIAREFGGVCNLRMDDTNPTKEDVEYVDSIIEDVKWLIGGWGDHILRFKRAGDTSGQGVPVCAGTEPFYASDYFQQLHDYAIMLIKAGKAYVCDLTPAQTDEYRGAPGTPGKPSPWRERSVEENLDLFARMKAGEFPDGARSLRAKIDMAHPNVWMRDPLLYRSTTTHTVSPIASKESRTPSARSNSRCTVHSTTGASTPCRCRSHARISTNSPSSCRRTSSSRSASCWRS
jgi:glutaminyl-tRNA synthetase